MDGGRAAARRVNHAMPRLVNQNRLVKVTKDNGDVIAFDYDYLSRRIKKSSTINNQLSTINYLYDGFNCIAEYTGTTISKLYTWGLDLSGTMQGAGGVGGLLAVKQGGASFYPAYDGNGNISEYLAANGTTAAHFEYDPFGNTVVDTDAVTKQFSYRFSTKPLDFETGFYYYTYRYYDPVAGRWPSRDPIGERRADSNGMNIRLVRRIYITDLPSEWTYDKKSKIAVLAERLNKANRGEISNLYVFSDNSPTNTINFLGLSAICTCTASAASPAGGAGRAGSVVITVDRGICKNSVGNTINAFTRALIGEAICPDGCFDKKCVDIGLWISDGLDWWPLPLNLADPNPISPPLTDPLDIIGCP
jgi:RHS repeat-associated protein